MRPTQRVLTALLGAAAAAGLALSSAPAAQASATDTGTAQRSAQVLAKLTHAQATAKFRSGGITWTSSGGCSDRNKPNCTSFDQLNSATADGAVTLKSASKCAVKLTGGTETGHASGTYSHWNGYKLDMALSSCLDSYIKGTFTSIGGSKWRSASGNIYYREGNHWDVTYYNCGGC